MYVWISKNQIKTYLLVNNDVSLWGEMREMRENVEGKNNPHVLVAGLFSPPVLSHQYISKLFISTLVCQIWDVYCTGKKEDTSKSRPRLTVMDVCGFFELR